MIITCPNCETQFKVDAAAFIPDGRAVRCAKCSHKWTQRPPEEAGAPAQAVDDAPPAAPAQPPPDVGDDDREDAPVDDFDDDEDIPDIVERSVVPDAAPSRGRGRAAAIGGWVALVLVVVAVLGGAFVLRVDIVDLWPPSSKLYTLIGFPVPSPFDGLEIVDELANLQTLEGGSTMIVVSGEIVNNSAEIRDVPLLRVVLLNVRGNPITDWGFAAAATVLEPGDATSFSSSYRDPPANTRNVKVSFAAPD